MIYMFIYVFFLEYLETALFSSTTEVAEAKTFELMKIKRDVGSVNSENVKRRRET